MTDNRARSGVRRAIRTVLAASCACSEHDFLQGGVTVTEAKALTGRMRLPLSSRPLLVVTMGAGVVVSCHPERLPWARSTLGHLERDAIFSPATIALLASYVESDGQRLAGPILKYTCSRADLRPTAAPEGIEICLVRRDAIPDLYRYRGFDNALSYRSDSPRPDVLATVATRGGAVLGIAGASADSDALWQIGVEVREEARGGGIGRALVGRLTEAILREGRIPYYSTTVSNIASRTLAVSTGYWPAWTELYAGDAPR